MIASRRGAGFLASTDTSFCTTPSSRSSKSLMVKPETGFPCRSVTSVEMRTPSGAAAASASAAITNMGTGLARRGKGKLYTILL